MTKKNSNADVHTLKQSPNTCKKSHQNTINQKDFCTSLNFEPGRSKPKSRSKPIKAKKKIKWTTVTGMKQTTLRSSLTNHILSAKASLSNKFLNYVICKKLPRFFHIFTDPKNSERFCLPPTHSFDLFPLTLFFVFVFIIQTFFVCPKFINRLKPTLFCRT